jgi:hypothetical protein
MVKDQVNDLASRAIPFALLWGVPIGIMLALNFFQPGARIATGVIVGCFTWMGLGCAINARRCRRRHCYLASPVLLAGAIMSGLVGFGLIDFGPDGLIYVVWVTFALVVLTFLPEKLYGKYRT